LAIRCCPVEQVGTAKMAISDSVVKLVGKIRDGLINSKYPPTIPDLSAWVKEDGTITIPITTNPFVKQPRLFDFGDDIKKKYH
jgi:hypothetical protein